jgi:hypothetical protein
LADRSNLVTDARPTRRELSDLYRDSDLFAAETDEWLARHKAERAALVRKNADEGVTTQDDGGDALPAVPAGEAEAFDFTEEQFDCLAAVLNELRKEFDARIARAEERILQATVRLILPGELAEREVHELRARVVRAEQQIERQLKAAITDDDNVIDLPAGFIGRRHDAA